MNMNEYVNLPRRVPNSWRKWQIWQKWRFWRNFAQGVDKIFRLHILTCLEGSQKVDEFGGNGDSDNILPKGLDEIFRLIILRTFARNFSSIDFFLKILPLKDLELAMSEM